MTPTPDAIVELRSRPQWVCWRYVKRPGEEKPTKPPFQTYGAKASTTDPKTWAAYAEVENAKTRFNGVGFVVAETDPYCGIDLDRCIDGNGEIAAWALAIVHDFNSYTEISPSERGLRIWIRGRLAGKGRGKKLPDEAGIEVYDRARFFTITERHLAGTPTTMEPRQEQLDAFMAEQFPDAPVVAPPPPRESVPASLSDRDLIEKAGQAANGHKFCLLFRGDWKAAGYGSHSEADLALCSHLRFWTRADRSAMDRLFRHSLLFREKWDELHGAKTYGDMTLDMALSGGGEVYTPLSGGLGRKGVAVPESKPTPQFVPEIDLEWDLERLGRLGRSPEQILKPDEWPAPLSDEAFYGLAGDFVRTIAPHTEADPAALLLSFLTSATNVMGLGPHMRVGPKVHRLREFVALVGATGSARKGTSIDFSTSLMDLVDASWRYKEGGLSSGEGLIWTVRDPITKKMPLKEKGRITGYQDEIVDEGIEDKRCLFVEEEFASALSAASREGNTLSAILRQVWDRDNIQSITKNSPAKATGAHVSCIVHITPEELRRNLSEIELANGFANRFLWCCSMRSRFLPHGGEQVNLQPLADDLSEVIRLMHMHARELRRSKEANAVWEVVYPVLTRCRPGMLGCVTSRAEAHALRLSGMYAALDGGHEIRVPHLLAALAVWDYCAASARYLFGERVGEPVADALLSALRECASEGLSRKAVREEVFHKNVSSEKIDTAVDVLGGLGLIVVEKENTAGRPRHVLRAVGGQKGRARGVLDVAKDAL